MRWLNGRRELHCAQSIGLTLDWVVEIRLNKLEPLPLQGTCAGSQVWNQEIAFAPGCSAMVRSPSGKGKTTLLSVLYGLRKDYQGQVRFDGEDIRHYGHGRWSVLRKKHLSFIFQDLQLFPDLTAWRNVELKNRLTKRKTEAEIRQMFETLGITHRMTEPVARLSLGQKQRVAIIRALCQPFEFILLDEPFSHLDPENINKAIGLIQAECQQQRAGFIITSVAQDHDLDCQMVLNL